MKPKLVVLNGPLQGTQFTLREETVSIGRHHESTLCIPDPRTSRHHCQIAKVGERFRLSDLKSSLGTFVNGVSIENHWLEHGDRIRIADSMLWFLLREEEPPATVPDELDPEDSTYQLTTTLQSGASRFLTGAIIQQEDLGIEHDMVGESPPMLKVYDLIGKVAPDAVSVLICGENGTGKELAAHAIHDNSPRSEGPFVAINCAALSEHLLEAELFGHEKGAFTSAHTQSRGKLEVGNGGTVFLDEVGELALPLQAKLLRVLEEREFERVGGIQPVRVDIRLLAATNKDLEQEIESGRFRNDLYFRLNVVGLVMPPLREYPEDIPLRAQHFAYRFSRAYNRAVTGISPEARACLMNHDWPGNVRELRNVIERAVVLGSSDVIQLEDLPETTFVSGPTTDEERSFHEAVSQFKKELVLKAVKEKDGVYKAAANRLGVHPSYLRRLIRSLNLRSEFRQ